MPGRQAHGRPLMSGASAGGKRKQPKSKAKLNKKALNAFAIASEEYSDKQKLTPRNRELDADVGVKHAREEEDDEDEEEDDGPPRKRRNARHQDSDVEYGSDSSGNEWKLGVDDDDDSDIESDDAFGESDEERFQGYAFGQSKKKTAKRQAGSDDDDDADGASLGSDAIDLAAALDMSASDDDVEGEESSEDEESGSDASGSNDESSDEDEDDVSESGMREWVSKFAGKEEEEQEQQAPAKTKIGLGDLGLLGVKDPQLKKSLKLMSKEEKSSKPQKLSVPLARRQQDRLDRSVAYEQTNKTLERWSETVKQNRRADHLMFPLAHTETGLARHDNSEIQPLNQKAPATELEQTILLIMEQSGLGPSAEKAAQIENDDGDEQQLSRKLLWQQKRRERELKTREEARAKRIKKIKSKAYHRVHRRQRERDELREHEELAEAGELDLEEERETQDRQRAMERMGARHKESKWAKQANKNGRAAWDDGVRMGIADMARRDEELRRRIEGKATKGDSDDDQSNFSGVSDDVDERKRLLKQLQEVEDDKDGASESKLMNMAFMKKAEAAKRKANDELVAEIRRDLASDDESLRGSDPELEQVGRRSYGLHDSQKRGKAPVGKRSKAKDDIILAPSEDTTVPKVDQVNPLSTSTSKYHAPALNGDAWTQLEATSTGPSHKKKGKKPDSSGLVIDTGLSSADVARIPATVAQTKPKRKKVTTNTDELSEDEDSHMPIQFREQELLDRAFGGLDAITDFEQEKREIEEEDGDKIIDNTLPGWGSWVGEGVSARERKRHAGRFLTKQEGIKKKDRKDAKLQGVIINEKRQKKNSKYLASQLPYQYESTQQYERALRLPVGPEWVTKETFQNATKPKVIVKQGIIKPMEKPMH